VILSPLLYMHNKRRQEPTYLATGNLHAVAGSPGHGGVILCKILRLLKAWPLVVLLKEKKCALKESNLRPTD